MTTKPFRPGAEPGTFYPLDVLTVQDIMDMAVELVEQRFQRGNPLGSPDETRTFLKIKFHGYEHEVFGAIFLDSQHNVLAFDLMFRGTIDSATIYPREVVKQALSYNAAAVIFVHNHPSGVADPSEADKRITKRLTDALSVLDIRVLDHFVVGGVDVVSFAERGLL
jgi:DNA repair protein RadC